MKQWVAAIRNGVVVFVLLYAQDFLVVRSFQSDHFYITLAMAVAWTCYELTRIFKITLNNGAVIKEKPNGKTLLLI